MPSAVVLLPPRRRYRASLGEREPRSWEHGASTEGQGQREPLRGFASASEFRLLVVDDDRLMTDLLPKKLARVMRPDVRIFVAGTVAEAQRLIERERPHAVVSDFNLREEWNGLDVLRHAKDHAPGCARILFSGHTRHEIGRPLEESGIDGYLEKPMRLDELIPSLLDLLHASTGLELRRD